jgi:hypothetical protein
MASNARQLPEPSSEIEFLLRKKGSKARRLLEPNSSVIQGEETPPPEVVKEMQLDLLLIQLRGEQMKVQMLVSQLLDLGVDPWLQDFDVSMKKHFFPN